MGGKSGPKAPSPQAQGAAQTATNKETSWYNALLQNMDQNTPYGSLTYKQSGTVDSPKWTSTINLSPEQQKILDSQNRQGIAMNQLGENQLGRIADAVSSPYSYSGIKNALPTYESLQDMSGKYTDAIMSRMNPRFAQDEEALRTRLINQGIGQGSQAYQREMDSFNQSKNDANIQALLSGQQYGSNDMNNLLGLRNQEINEYSTQRNAPLNEYIGLTSGSQITNPSFSSAGNQGIQPFDMAGSMRDYYSNQQAAANNKSSAMSSAFGLGGQALGAAGMLGGLGASGGGFLGAGLGSLFALSDERLKENIVYAGTENGHNIYEFNYRGEPDGKFVGVIAQEVLEKMPEAVKEVYGYLAVDYSKIGVNMREVS